MYYEYYQETNPTFHVLDDQTFERENYKYVFGNIITRVEFADVDDDNKVLEHLYTIHNADNRPRNQEIRSMSVGDIVVIERGHGINKTVKSYVCNDFGWKQIEFDRYNH